MREISENLGARLLHLRTVYGLSRFTIAHLLNISEASIFRLEHRPEKHKPHPFLREKVERLLKVLEKIDEAKGRDK